MQAMAIPGGQNWNQIKTTPEVGILIPENQIKQNTTKPCVYFFRYSVHLISSGTYTCERRNYKMQYLDNTQGCDFFIFPVQLSIIHKACGTPICLQSADRVNPINMHTFLFSFLLWLQARYVADPCSSTAISFPSVHWHLDNWSNPKGYG